MGNDSLDIDVCSEKKKNKTKRNAFSSFLFEFAKEHQMSMSEAQEEAGDKWDQMTDEEKSTYQAKSEANNLKKAKEAAQYTSYGVSIDDILRQEQESKKKVQRMELTIAEILERDPSPEGVKATEFYFISASYYYKSNDIEVYPAELACAKFSLQEGVIDTLHFKIDPGKLPCGALSTALEHASKTHMYEVPAIDGEENYEKIFTELVKFLGGINNLPPIFIHPDGNELEDVALVLDAITARLATNITFRLYPLENLLLKLDMKLNAERDLSYKKLASVPAARRELMNDEFQYHDLGCAFHIALDKSSVCCLSKVKRWGYLLAKKCLIQKFDRIIPGKHKPSMMGDDETEVISVSSKDSEFSNENDVMSAMDKLSIDGNDSDAHSVDNKTFTSVEANFPNLGKRINKK